jgi:hypothetical protein
VAPLVSSDALFHRRVIERATQANDKLKYPLLRGGGTLFLFERLARHLLFRRPLFCLIGGKSGAG